jgi:hypothetical protein
MAINFPDSPTTDQIHTAGGRSWQWTGSVWEAYSVSVFDGGTIGQVWTKGADNTQAWDFVSGGGSAPGTPDAPTLVAATTTTLEVEVDAVSGATGYKWYLDTVFVASSSSPTYTFTGLTENTEYDITVSATNAYGESAQSAALVESTSAGSTLKTNLVAYYDMAGTGNLTDLHGSKTMTLNGTIGSVTGPVSAEYGRGKDDTNSANRFQRSDDADFEPGSSHFSIAMWVRTNQLDQSAWPGIFGKMTDSSGQKEWSVLMRGNEAGRLRFIVSGDGSAETTVDAASLLSSNTWAFVGACWDGSNIKISLNGAAFATTSFSGPVYAGTAAIDLFFRQGGSSSFRGDIGPTAFWKGRALTLAEFQSIYNSGSGLPYSSW